MRIFHQIVCSLAVTIVCGVSVPRCWSQGCPSTLVIAAGPEGRAYYRLANALKSRVAARKLDLQTLATNGSKENVDLLNECKAQFALVQSDVAHQAVHGHRPFDRASQYFRVVAPLYTESVQILVRSHLFIFTVAELKGKVVSLGPAGSGTEQTARAVLEAAAVSLKEIDVRHLDADTVTEQLRSGEIDAAFLTTASPTPSIAAALGSDEARLLPLESRVIDRLVKDGSYIETYIPRGIYRQERDFPTVGVQALLVTRSDTDRAVVDLLYNILYSDRKDVEAEADVKLDALETMLVQVSSLPLYPLTRIPPSRLPTIWIASLILILLAGLISVFYVKRAALQRVFYTEPGGQERLLPIVVVGVIVWLLGSGGLYYTEHHVNENFDSFAKSAWSMLVYVAGGFQTRVPITRGGEVVAVFSIVFGLGLIAWFTAELASHLVKHELNYLYRILGGRRSMPKDLQGHMVIVNWDERAEDMVSQLHGPDFKRKTHIVVVSEARLELPDRPEFKLVYSVLGDPRQEQTLREAHAADAHSVTILSAWPVIDAHERRKTIDPDVADTRTIGTIQAVRTLCRKEGRNEEVCITAEIRARRNCDLARHACTGGKLEIICVEDFGMELLTQCAVTPGLGELYQNLLTFKKTNSEVYRTKVPVECVGKSFGGLIRYFAERRQEKQGPIIPIAVYRESRLHVNPQDADIQQLDERDWLFVIADHEPSEVG
jgi:TRAP transporter TAXI family solute receptor